MSVPARLGLVTLGVADLDRAVSFYSALGWEKAESSNDQICWFRTADTHIGLFSHEELAADANLPAEPRAPFGGITLAINTNSEAEADEIFEAALAVGATELKRPVRAEWGGYSGYFADPDGHPWEVAYNPSFPVGDDGRLRIP